MPPLALIGPVLIPIAAGVAAASFGWVHWRGSRAIAAAGVWLALLAIIALWLRVRSTEEFSAGQLGFGAGLDLRLDAVAVVFGVVVLLPSAMLLSFQARSWQESALACVGVAATVLALESGNVLLTAVGGCTAATLAIIQFDVEDRQVERPSWAMLLGAWLILAWAGVILDLQGGTAVYEAIPVSAQTAPAFALLGIAALIASGLVPWRGWAAQIWTRPSLRAAALTFVTVQPLGIYVLIRAYEIGNGRYPQVAFNVILAAWGVLVAFGAAARAQSAATRSEYMAETLPGLAGFTLMSVAVGSGLGMVAALILLASSALIATCLPLSTERRSASSLLAVAVAAGLPPGLAFGGRLLGLSAGFEAGGAFGLVAVGGAATWLLSAAAAARSVGLPAGRAHPAREARPAAALILGAIGLALGPALGVASVMVRGAAADVMSLPAGSLGADPTFIVTVSAVLPAAALLGPLLVLGAAALLLSRPSSRTSSVASRAPLFAVAGAAAIERLGQRFRSASVPQQYRSLFDSRALDAVAAGGRPALWLAAVVALALAVTR